ncbi:uncharacterized protein LOC100382697 [Zea mays]|uniref:Uncharacterized protein n=1 Tax=Zea mays TaxID=4577 RepID=C0P9V3_MAIZE|nr:uncharacterized protein LOC100382697 [Zea mays]ACN30948.1 unknown [Zea mays]|eukprot:NP_001168892.1 uncharacterized protein LOC100382697 [Zea mays]
MVGLGSCSRVPGRISCGPFLPRSSSPCACRASSAHLPLCWARAPSPCSNCAPAGPPPRPWRLPPLGVLPRWWPSSPLMVPSSRPRPLLLTPCARLARSEAVPVEPRPRLSSHDARPAPRPPLPWLLLTGFLESAVVSHEF